MMRTCLIVEEDNLTRRCFELLIQELDVRTLSVSNAVEALTVLERVPGISLVMTEEFLPGGSGTSLLRAVRYRWPRVARVLISGALGPDVLVRAINSCGVHRVLSKGMHAVALRDEIEGALNEAWLAANEFHSGRLTTPPHCARDFEQAADAAADEWFGMRRAIGA
jgi:DNA-binding NtrC family response regulator